MTIYTCSCGVSDPHVVAKRRTFDGVSVEGWSDGSITIRFGEILKGGRLGDRLWTVLAEVETQTLAELRARLAAKPRRTV